MESQQILNVNVGVLGHVDCGKTSLGVQAQTAECLVVGEVVSQQLLVVLNKADLLPQEQRAKAIRKAQKRVKEALAGTKFARAPMVAVSARPGGESSSSSSSAPEGMQELQALLVQMAPCQARPASGDFLFAVDHCFSIKGQGTVLTGTCLKGEVKVGSILELPTLKVTRQVKSMQMFKRPVQSVQAGDRAGICITKMDPTLLERGLAAAPGSVPTCTAAVARVEKIRFYPGRVTSKSKLHVIVGHQTVMASLTFFGAAAGEGWRAEDAVAHMIDSLTLLAKSDDVQGFQWGREYLYQQELYGLEGRPPAASAPSAAAGPEGDIDAAMHHGPQWALLEFEQPVIAPKDAMVIGARLDADVHGEACRLAFYGRMLGQMNASDPKELQRLRIYKEKKKVGTLSRIGADLRSAVCSNMFKKETDINAFVGLKVVTGRGEVGTIGGRFGTSGRFTVQFDKDLVPASGRHPGDNVLELNYKRFMFDENKRKVVQ